MRFTPAAIATAIILGTFSSASIGSAPRVDPIAPLSLDMQREAERLQSGGQLDDAIGYFETALLADPRNINAYIGLAQIAQAQALPGKAVRYFREALLLQPDNRTALAGQGIALVERGAIEKARQNLALLQTACGSRRCAEVTRLETAISTAGERTALRAADVEPHPVVEAATTPAQN
jgi:Tfp pilus assembly protein PilF